MPVHNVRDFGAIGDNVADDSDAIQAALDASLGLAGGTVLDFPPGEYRISRPLAVHLNRDFDTRLHLKGSGRRGTAIRQSDPTANILELRNDAQNLRGIVIDDLWFAGGAVALWLQRCSYALFRNLAFFNTGKGPTASVVTQHGCSSVSFRDCWWVHTTGDAIRHGSGDVSMVGCVFGEDCGAIRTHDQLSLLACKFVAPMDKAANLSGARGRASITVGDYGRLSVVGCHGTAGPNFLNLDTHRRVLVASNRLDAGAGTLITNRHAGRNHPLIFTGNQVAWRSPDAAFFRATLGQMPQNWLIKDNSFESAVDPCPTPADLDYPGNIVRDNLFRVGPF